MVQPITKKNFDNVFQICGLLVCWPSFYLIFESTNQRNIQEESRLTEVLCIMADSFSISHNGFS